MVILPRRRFLHLGVAALGSLALPGRSRGDDRAPCLLVLFLRGGMDGLNVVPPYGDEGYRRARPRIGVPGPGERGGGAIALEAGVGVHPGLAPVLDAWSRRELAIVAGVGVPSGTRSHFDAQDEAQRGPGATYEGWASHWARADGGTGPTSAAIATTLPRGLWDDPGAVAVGPGVRPRFARQPRESRRRESLLRTLYADASGPPGAVGRRALETLALVRATRPAPGFPDGALGRRLAYGADLVRRVPSIRLVWVDDGGWDDHRGEGGLTGRLASRLETLGEGLAALYRTLRTAGRPVAVLVLTEFGRTLRENSARGTDHGLGSAALLWGNDVAGGRCYGAWALSPRDNAAAVVVPTPALVDEVGSGVFAPGRAGGALGLFRSDPGRPATLGETVP